MLGSLMSMVGYMLVLMVLGIWMVVKIWRRSPLLAILSFFFWPIAPLVALFMYWGDEESDIRLPFFLSVIVFGLMMFMAMRAVEKGVQEAMLSLTEEELQFLSEEDPEFAAAIEEARQEQLAARGESSTDVERDAASGTAATPRPRAADSVPHPSNADAGTNTPDVAVARDPAEMEAQHRLELERAAGAVSWQFGRAALGATGVTLQIPQHFRFAQRGTLLRVARLRNVDLPSDVLGWVVHRNVQLGSEDAWYVQVRYRPLSTPVAPPDVLSADKMEMAAAQTDYVSRIVLALDNGAARPQVAGWDAATGVATWVRPAKDPAATSHADYMAARMLKDGVLEFSVPDLHERHAELGTRSVRLMAERAVMGAPAAAAPAR